MITLLSIKYIIFIFLLRSEKKNQEIISSLHSLSSSISFLSNKGVDMILSFLKDSAEIITLSSFFYCFSCWLKKDKENNLLWYFYSYCFLFFGSWYLNLFVINAFMLYTSPLIFLLMVIIHQNILQRNFISMKKTIPALKNSEYVEELIRAGLSTLNKNKIFYCVLEHAYELKPFIAADFFLKTEINQMHISYLLDNPNFDEKKFLWCSTQGYILATNAQWKIHHTQSSVELPSYRQNQWKEDALLITAKTDAYVIKGNPSSRLFDLVSNGRIHEQLSAPQIVQLLKKYLIQSPLMGEKVYESSHQKILNPQQNP